MKPFRWDKISLFTLPGLLLILHTSAWANGIKAQLDRPEISMQDELLLTVTVEGNTSATPTLPQLVDFDVVPKGRSTQMQIINGRMSQSAIFGYALTPKKPGNHTIPPIEVTLDRQNYQTKPLSVHVLAESATLATHDRNLFITAEVSNHEPYIGEQIIYTWKFYRRERIANASVTLPNFDHFLVESLGEQHDYNTNIQGVAYNVTEIRKALFAQEPGRWHIPAASLKCDVSTGNRRVDDFFGSPFAEMMGQGTRKTMHLRSSEIDLNVLPLPPPPADFYNMVGDFELQADLSESHIKVGDSTTLTLTVRGTGFINTSKPPPVEGLTTFKTYDDKVISDTHAQGNKLAQSRIYRKALVPTQAGVFELEPIKLSYFSPSERSYKHIITSGFTLHITPGEQTLKEPANVPHMAPTVQKSPIHISHDDIMPIVTKANVIEAMRANPQEKAAWVLAFVLPPWMLGMLIWWQHYHHQAKRLEPVRKRRLALRTGLKIAEQIDQQTNTTDFAKTAAAIASQAMRQYIGTMLYTEGLALTPQEIKQCLLAQPVAAQKPKESRELADLVQKWLEHCDALQYSTSAASSRSHKLGRELADLLKKIDKLLRS